MGFIFETQKLRILNYNTNIFSKTYYILKKLVVIMLTEYFLFISVMKYVSGGFFILLWVLYVVLASLKAYDYISF